MKTEPKTETAKHAPGPWMEKIEQAQKSLRDLVSELERQHDDTSRVWAYVEDIADIINDKTAHAAPELLEALRGCVRIVGEYRQKVITGHLTGTLIEGDYEPYAAGLAAIAKAEGRTV